MKYKRSTSPFLCKENRIRTIHVSVAIESNTLILELVTAVLSGTHILGQFIEIQGVRNAFSTYGHLETCPSLPRNTTFLRPMPCYSWPFVEHPGQFQLEALVSFKAAV